jgi:hypothetical protein
MRSANRSKADKNKIAASVFSFKTSQNFVELIVIAITDGKRPAAGAVVDTHDQAKRIRESLFERYHIRVLLGAGMRLTSVALAVFLACLARQRFDLTHIETA